MGDGMRWIGMGLTALALLSIPPAAVAQDSDPFQPVRDSLQAHVERGSLPGAVHLVMRGDDLLELTAVGFDDVESGTPVHRRSIFRLASATKIWVSVGLMTLVEEGRVVLDAPVSRYLPEFGELTVLARDGAPVPTTRQLTVEDLLRHSGGMGYGYEEPYQSALAEAGLLEPVHPLGMDWSHPWSLAEWAGRLADVPLEGEPGVRFSYGLHHDVVGALIERVTGQSLGDFMAERVFEPLGLRDTGFSVPEDRLGDLTSFYNSTEGGLERMETGEESPFRSPPRAASGGGGWDQIGNGGMVSSAPDFARLLQMIMLGGTLDGVTILSEESVALLRSNRLEATGNPDSFWPGAGFSFGFAYLYDAERFPDGGNVGKMWWAGSTNVYFWMDPAEDLVGVFMTHVLPFGYLGVMDTVERLTYEAIGR
jgi:CubicO group peptidase (beta-lactamase class C family)